MSILLPLVLIVTATPLAAAEDVGEIDWARQFGTLDSDWPTDVALGPTGAYVAGDTHAETLLGDPWDAFPGEERTGSMDGFVVKLDEKGGLQWNRQFGGGEFTSVGGLAVDATGVYVAGWTHGALPGEANLGQIDAYVRKFDPEGSEIWTQQIGTPQTERAYGLALGDHGLYLVGATNSTSSSAVGGVDAFVLLLTRDGEETWSRQFGTRAHDSAGHVALDTSGVYVVGTTSAALVGEAHKGMGDAFLRKYTHQGDLVWTRQFGTQSEDVGAGVAVDDTGVYVAGWTWAALPGEGHAGGIDSFLRKFSHDGVVIWTRQFGTETHDTASGIALDDRGLYVVGSTYGMLAEDVGPGRERPFLRAYDRHGKHLWTLQLGEATGLGEGAAVAANGTAVYLVGPAAGLLAGEMQLGAFDGFVARVVPSPARIEDPATPDPILLVTLAAGAGSAVAIAYAVVRRRLRRPSDPGQIEGPPEQGRGRAGGET